MPPQASQLVECASRRDRHASSITRARTPVAPVLLLLLGTLVTVVSACTTEIVTAVPETVEEPGSEDPRSEEPDSDEDSDPGDDPDDDGQEDDDDQGDDESDDDDSDEDDEGDDDEDDDDGDDDSDGGDEPDPNGEEVHGIPTGQMPPPGACRIWDPDLSPGQQAPPGDCGELRGRLPPGSWLLFRPNAEPRVYRIA